MLLAVVRGAEGGDLGVRQAVEREPGTRDQLHARRHGFAGDQALLDRQRSLLRPDDPQRRQQPRQPGEAQRRFGGSGRVERNGIQRPQRLAIEIAARVGERERGVRVEPVGALDQHRRRRVRGVAQVGQRKRGGAFAAD